MLSECLGDSSMRLGVPFIAPRQLGAVGGKLGRPSLPSVVWCTGQSGTPPDNYCSCSVHDFFPYGEQSTVVASGPLAHRTLSGAHRTVRCPPPTIGAAMRRAKIVRPTVGASDRWLTGQSGTPPDNYCSCSVHDFFPYGEQSTVVASGPLAHRALSGAHRTVRCPPSTIGAAMRRAKIVRPTVGASDRWLTGQSGTPPDSPVNYSHVAHLLFLRAPSSPWMTHRTVRCTTGRSGEL
jgi:hypothetical protein